MTELRPQLSRLMIIAKVSRVRDHKTHVVSPDVYVFHSCTPLTTENKTLKMRNSQLRFAHIHLPTLTIHVLCYELSYVQKTYRTVAKKFTSLQCDLSWESYPGALKRSMLKPPLNVCLFLQVWFRLIEPLVRRPLG